VIITGRRRKEAIETAAQALNVKGLVADEAVLSDNDKLAAEVSQQFGKIEILLCTHRVDDGNYV
jgi:short-subunit dehydrogenase involved in D-alanine esterification of teichoic acids